MKAAAVLAGVLVHAILVAMYVLRIGVQFWFV